MTSTMLRFALAIGCVLLASAAQAERRLALVIGNSAYAQTPLRNPENDARLIAGKLRIHGFDVTERENLGQQDMRRAIADFADQVRAVQDDEKVALIFYAGHGVQVQGVNYLIPVDAVIRTATDASIYALKLDDILASVAQAEPHATIVVLDACRNNPFLQGSRSLSRGLAPVDAKAGSMIAYSTAPGQIAVDGDKDNSPYSAALARTMDDPELEIEGVFKKVRLAVRKATANQQTPWESSSLTTSFRFPQGKKPGKIVPPDSGPEAVISDGVDFPGNDYRNIRGTTYDACYQSCKSEMLCQAFTFNRRVGACFLKEFAGQKVTHNDAVSGVFVNRGAQFTGGNAEATISNGVDIPGNDYRELWDIDYDTCYTECKSDPVCRAFTYNRRADACFLKNSIGLKTTHEDAISGVFLRRRHPNSGRTDSINYHYVTGLDPNGWNWLALRRAPSFTADWSDTHMGPDTLLQVIGREGEWLHVRLLSGETGWANSHYVACCKGLEEGRR